MVAVFRRLIYNFLNVHPTRETDYLRSFLSHCLVFHYRGIYSLFIKTSVSCFDGKQDQGEQGIDCGGPCATVCTAGAQPIAVVSVQAFVSTPGHDTFLAQIANTNAALAAASFDYAFNFYDASDALLQSVPGQSFMYSANTKYILLPNQTVPSAFDHILLVVSTTTDWVSAQSFGAVPRIAVPSASSLTTTIGSSTKVTSGQITNNDTATFDNVLIIAIFKNASGTALGASQTEINSIAPGATQNFSIIYPAIAGVDPTQTEVAVDALRN